jgi:hypothetical protein
MGKPAPECTIPYHRNCIVSIYMIGWLCTMNGEERRNLTFPYLALFFKNAVFWVVAPCIFCVNRRFGGSYRLHLQGGRIYERGTSVSK